VVEAVKAMTAELRERRAVLRATKKDAYNRPEVAEAMLENARQAKAEAAEVKQESGLYWATEATVRAACGSFASGAPPRFARWTGEGQLAVQFIGGLPVEELTQPNTLCWVEGEGRVRQAHFRVTSQERRPVWVTVPVVWHRDLPEGGSVKWAFLERRKLANKDRFKLRLSIEVPDVEPTTPPDSMAVLHLGWRSNPDGSVRVAMVGNGQRSIDVVLPWKFFDGWDRLDVVRSARDRSMNDAKELVAQALRIAVEQGGEEVEEWPEFLQEAKAHGHLWRSPARLVGLWRKLSAWIKDQVGTNIDVGWPYLERDLGDWVKADRLLWQHEARLRKRLIGWRNDFYRNTAAGLARRVRVVAVGAVPVEELTRCSQPEDLKADPTASHRRARLAAVSTLRRFVEEQFPCRTVHVDQVNLSTQCAECGHVNTRADGFSIKCGGCGAVFDIDANAMRNTHARAKAMVEGGHLLALAEAAAVKKEQARERLLKMQDAARKKNAARKLAAAGGDL
jgi:hypothetical protein